MLLLAAGLLMRREDFEQAHARADEALALCEMVDDRRGIAYSLDLYASLLAARGRADAAARLWGASDALLATVGGSLVPTMRWIRLFRAGESIPRSIILRASAPKDERCRPTTRSLSRVRRGVS